MEGFNAGQFEAARRALEACERETDPRTREALARLSWKYTLGACGMDRAGATGEPTPAFRVGGTTRAASRWG